jgi:hypothetical protein
MTNNGMVERPINQGTPSGPSEKLTEEMVATFGWLQKKARVPAEKAAIAFSRTEDRLRREGKTHAEALDLIAQAVKRQDTSFFGLVDKKRATKRWR